LELNFPPFAALTVVDVLLPTTQALVRESERRRYADPAQVDRVIALDQVWRDGASAYTCSLGPSRGDRAQNAATHPESCTCFAACFSARYALDNLNKEYNALNKAVAKLKIVRLRSKRLTTTSTAGTDAACSLCRLSIPTQAGEDASQQIEQCANLDKQRLTAEVRASARCRVSCPSS
jgi:hypothetical protein